MPMTLAWTVDTFRVVYSEAFRIVTKVCRRWADRISFPDANVNVDRINNTVTMLWCVEVEGPEDLLHEMWLDVRRALDNEVITETFGDK